MISVIACTKREGFIKNIIDNFQRQSLIDKELILIVHSSSMDLDGIKRLLDENKVNATLLQFSEAMSLGECLNKGVELASYDYVAKMDDDDYYGEKYLNEAFDAIVVTQSDVVGKGTFYIYFEKSQEVCLYNPYHENYWIINNGKNRYSSSYFLSGASMVIRKEIFDKVSFPSINLGEDGSFQRLCFENKLKMYSLTKNHYVYIRYDDPAHHTSDAKDRMLRWRSRFITKTDSLENFMKQKEGQ